MRTINLFLLKHWGILKLSCTHITVTLLLTTAVLKLLPWPQSIHPSVCWVLLVNTPKLAASFGFVGITVHREVTEERRALIAVIKGARGLTVPRD